MKRAILKYTAYALLAIGSFVLFLYLTFPQAVILALAGTAVRDATGMTLEAESAGLRPPAGVRLTGVRLVPAAPGAPEIRLDSVGVGVSVLAGLSGRLALSVGASGYGGSIDVDLSKIENGFTAEGRIEDLKIEAMDFLARGGELPLKGMISLQGSIDASKGALARLDGELRLGVRGAVAGPGKVSGMSMPMLNLGALSADLQIDKGTLTIANCRLQGGDIDGELAGTIGLKSVPAQSRLQLYTRFKLRDEVVAQNDILKLALSAIADAKKTADGMYYHKLSGRLDEPHFARDPAGLFWRQKAPARERDAEREKIREKARERRGLAERAPPPEPASAPAAPKSPKPPEERMREPVPAPPPKPAAPPEEVRPEPDSPAEPEAEAPQPAETELPAGAGAEEE